MFEPVFFLGSFILFRTLKTMNYKNCVKIVITAFEEFLLFDRHPIGDWFLLDKHL